MVYLSNAHDVLLHTTFEDSRLAAIVFRENLPNRIVQQIDAIRLKTWTYANTEKYAEGWDCYDYVQLYVTIYAEAR